LQNCRQLNFGREYLKILSPIADHRHIFVPISFPCSLFPPFPVLRCTGTGTGTVQYSSLGYDVRRQVKRRQRAACPHHILGYGESF